MKTDVNEIRATLIDILKANTPPLKIRTDKDTNFEVAGTKETMQGKQKVDGMYFGSIVPKPKDVRLYYFPIYMYPDEFYLPDDLKKCLKGKSCFHIKKLDDNLENEIKAMIAKGVELYKKNDLV